MLELIQPVYTFVGMQFNTKTINLQRYPKTNNRSLRPWSAADELLLSKALELGLEKKKIVLINDSFGALATALNPFDTHTVANNQSQVKATKLNLESAGVNIKEWDYSSPLKLQIELIDIALLKVPKSAELFRLYLQQVYTKSTSSTVVLCGFMTRNYTPQWLEIAEHYFAEVTQSLAVKKARVLVLKKPKKNANLYPLFHTIKNELDLNLKHYSGVFSGAKVDVATQLLLEHLPKIKNTDAVLDLACGNGVVGAFVRKIAPSCTLSLIDDSFLAISSAKLNVPKDKVSFHWSDSVRAVKEHKFDFVLCNPPFHFEYENTIEIALNLFEEVASVLKSDGSFFVVANAHLNYRSQLIKLFSHVSLVIQNGKYEVIVCKN